MKHALTTTLLAALLASCIGNAFAQSAAPLPDWDKLTPAQRETLLAPLRDRWNSGTPDERARMFGHAQRWQQMTPEQRARAHEGMRHFEHLSPEQREAARALFAQMRHMSPEQRQQLVQQWKAMTPDQRHDWLLHNPPPPEMDLPPPPPR